MQKYILDTANYSKYKLAKKAAEKAGLTVYKEYRPTCCKCYHLETIADGKTAEETLDKMYIQDLIASASFDRPGVHEDIAKLAAYTYGDYESIAAFQEAQRA